MNEKKRIALREEMEESGDELPGFKVFKPATWFFGAQYVCMVIVSWVVSTFQWISWKPWLTCRSSSSSILCNLGWDMGKGEKCHT
jgi:hypothetical protein